MYKLPIFSGDFVHCICDRLRAFKHHLESGLSMPAAYKQLVGSLHSSAISCPTGMCRRVWSHPYVTESHSKMGLKRAQSVSVALCIVFGSCNEAALDVTCLTEMRLHDLLCVCCR